MKEKTFVEISPELVRRARNGDSAAFTELYQKSGPSIYRTVYSMVRDEELAWDVHQNVYLLAWQNLSGLEKPELFLPWLRRIAVREAIRELKKEQPLCFTELTDEEDEEPQFPETREDYQPELQMDRQEAARLVREILDQMPQKQKLIVGMYYYEQYSIKEIAEALNVTQGTVKTQLHLGRKRVEAEVRRLEGRGVKLYGLAPMDFLAAQLDRMPLPAREPGAALAKTLTKAGVSTETGAAAPAAETVVLHAAKPFFSTLAGKLVLGVAAVGVVAAGAVGYRWAKDTLFQKPDAILVVDRSEELRHDPTAPTLPVEIDVTGPAEIDTTIPVPSTAEDTTEPAEPDHEAENTAFLSITGGAALNDNVLGVICNASALEGTAPTVVWNEGEQDSLVICPRYPGSTVEARWFQRFENDRVDIESETPRFTALCGQGDSIGAALERPEDGSGWFVTVRTPDGREGGWILTRNSQNGTPAYEFIIGGSYDWESEESQDFNSSQEQEIVDDHLLVAIGKEAGYDYQFIFNTSSEVRRSLTRPLSEGLLCSISRSLYHDGPLFVWNNWVADESTIWTVSKSQMQGDTCCTEAVVVHEYYMEEIGRGTKIWAPRDLTVEETAVRQAELFAERRMLGYVGVADEDVVLHFDLGGVQVYNPTLNAKTVSITVNGQEAGSFSLTEGDFFTQIPLDYPDLPGDHAVRIEARVTECSFGTPEQAVLVLRPNLYSIFVGGR